MPHHVRRIFTTCGVVAALVAGMIPAAGATDVWTTYHADPGRTGADTSEAPLDPAVAAWTADLGGAVYGQPVVADGRVFAATETNRVSAMDAHDGHVLWSQSLGSPLANVQAAAGCGDISPLGVTSTPVIDAATHTVYVVGEVSDGANVIHHQLVGYDTYTGVVKVSDNVDPPLPAGENALYLLQRAALALGNGRVYVSYGGNDGDCEVYQGWVVGVNETGPPALVSFDAAGPLTSGPIGQGGAIWEAGSGPAIAADGSLFVSTGNPNGGTNPPYAESVVKLSPTLAIEKSVRDTQATGDQDLATNNPVLLPNGTLFAVGKTDIGYVLRQSDLTLVHTIAGICGSDPDGGPAYDAATNTIYVPCVGGGIQAVDLTSDTLGPQLSGANSAPILVGSELWAAQSHTTKLSEFPTSGGLNPIQTLTTPAVTPSFASPSAALGLLLIGTTTGVTAFDGPSGPPAPAPAPAAAPTPASGPQQCLTAPPAGGYLMAASDGGVFDFGGASFCGSAGGQPLAAAVVGLAAERASSGYWLAGRDGGVFAYASGFYGSLGGQHLNQPVVGIAGGAGDSGYWLVAADGGVFSFGTAAFHGSTGGLRLNRPIVGIAATADGGGYWLVASDGGVFSFGDATFHGSTGALRLNRPIVGIAATADGGGYWLVASDGGVFSFGDATFHGSTGALRLVAPVVGVARSARGGGYVLAAADGGVFTFGDATFGGSLGGRPLNRPILAVAAP